MKRSLAVLLFLGFTLAASQFVSKAAPMSVGLAVDESRIEGSSEGQFFRVVLPVRNSTSMNVTASGKVQIYDLTGKSYGLSDRIFGVRQNGLQLVTVRVPVRTRLTQHPGFYLLKYQIISNSGIVQGTQSLLPIVQPVMIRVLGGDRFTPGQNASLRVMVLGTSNGIAIRGAVVRAQLRSSNKSFDLFRGLTASNGTLPVRFQVPALSPGTYDLILDAESGGSRQQIVSKVKLETMYKIYITSDKPIYQPSQRMYFRAIALSAIQQSPASASDFTWEIYDPKGNRLLKKLVRTDRFGVASAEFDLANEVNLGTYKIRGIIRNGGFEQFSEKDVTVSRYVLPKFKVEINTEKNYYLPGETVRGDVNARYFFGKPVQGKVQLTGSKFDIGFSEFWNSSLVLKEGKVHFEFALPQSFAGTPLEQGNAAVEIHARIVDSASQDEESTKKVTVTADPILIAAIPASLKMIRNIENRLLIVTQYPDGTPAQTQIQMGDVTARSNAFGVAVLKFIPGGEREATIHAKDSAGKFASHKIAFDVSNQGVIVMPSRGIYRTGDKASLEIFSNLSRTIFLDFIKQDQLLKTEAVEVTSGKASCEFDLSPDFVGSVLVNAYAIGRDGEIYRDSKWIVVEPARDLNITVRPGKTEYRPGENARLQFKVTDQNGRPVAAALGVAVVDEAVFSVSELRPGLEKVYFLLEEELQKPRYEIHSLSFASMLIEREINQVRAEAALATAPRDFHYKMSITSYDDTAKKFVAEFQPQLATQFAGRFEKISSAIQVYRNSHSSFPYSSEALNFLVQKRILSPDVTLDPWDEVLVLKTEATEIYPWNFQLISKGPDKQMATADDLIFSPSMRKRGEFAFDGILNLGAMVKSEALPMEDAKDRELQLPASIGGSTEPRVREFFPETLFFEPSLITDRTGVASLEIPMADSITDWRVSVTGSSETGSLGSTTTGIRVFQDFFVDLDLPVALTKGDEVSVPVSVYNYLSEPQNVRLQLQQAAWFVPLEGESMNLLLQPNQVSSAYFRIRAQNIGKQKLTLKAYGSKLSDALQKEIWIEPNGRKLEESVNGRLASDVAASLKIPVDALEGSTQLMLKIYPGMFNQLLEGLDSILQMPFGCFEQTSSATYPNVLALQYMKSSRRVTPEIQMKAEGFINLGYQRLVTFEVDGGGFSWFGQAPAHKILTAYGLMEFQDMSGVYDIDPALISRTAQWLVSQQQQDGSWKPDQGGIAEGAINRYQTDVARITSYIGWALLRSGGDRNAIERAATYVRTHSQTLRDPYGLAVAANFLLARDSKDPDAIRILGKLFDLRIEDTESIYWKQEEPTAVFSEGVSANVETTALAALAMMKNPEYSGASTKALTYLIKQKDARGTWHSTQATIWALRAFVEGLSDKPQAADAVVEIILNGKSQKSITLNSANADILQMVNLSDAAVPGNNELQIKMHGKAQSLFALVAQYAVPWKDLPENEALNIRIAYDKSNLEVDDTATARVTVRNNLAADAEMVMVDLGIPPGFRINASDFEALVRNQTIRKYDLTGRQAILYFDKIRAGQNVEFRYRLTAKYPLRASTLPARVYQYYNPQRQDTASPLRLVVQKSKAS